MDIDVFYRNGDASFGVDGNKNFVEEFSWPMINASGPEQEALSSYRKQLTPKMKSDCAALATLLSQVKSEIEIATAGKIAAKSSEKKKIEQKIAGLEKAKNEIQAAYNSGKCDAKIAQKDQDALYAALGVGKGPDVAKVGTYLIVGGIGVVALAVGVILYRKFRKK